MSEYAGERIAKIIARSGFCSRRDAEKLITEGRVQRNGAIVASAACNVSIHDLITIDNTPLKLAEPTRLWRYHKPRGLLVSHKDPQGRPTVFETLRSAQLPRLISIGRLDFNSEGLLLLTNDGRLARFLELPAHEWTRHYRVRAFGSPDEHALIALAEGIKIGDVNYGKVEAKLIRKSNNNCWLNFTLREGKNREIRRICEHLNLQVNRLIRVGFGPFELNDLARGAYEEVAQKLLQKHFSVRL